MPDGLPLLKPPYSRMTAIDLNTGEHIWMTPTGNGDRIRTNPRLRDLTLPPLGGDGGAAGPLVTKTLLLYPLTAGGPVNGPRLVAYLTSLPDRNWVGAAAVAGDWNTDDLHGRRKAACLDRRPRNRDSRDCHVRITVIHFPGQDEPNSVWWSDRAEMSALAPTSRRSPSAQ